MRIFEEIRNIKKRKSVSSLVDLQTKESKRLMLCLLGLYEKMVGSNQPMYLEFITKLKEHLL